MINYRKHGTPPYQIAGIHGGPGGAGEVYPVAQHLAKDYGVLEPLQTKTSFEGQLEELRMILETQIQPPVILVGYSYGALLSFVLAARYPTLVKKLILVSSGVFEGKYATGIMETRFNRLNLEERRQAEALMKQLEAPHVQDKNAIVLQHLELINRADSYDPLPFDNTHLEASYEIFSKVWPEVQALRGDGKLLAYGHDIRCPVVAIHGDYDPHPVAGIQKPLARVLHDFRLILLEKCGHHPWFEKHAKDEFYRVLEREVRIA
jgi:pimeloyl-ACP methyl ester carboxylesterase